MLFIILPLSIFIAIAPCVTWCAEIPSNSREVATHDTPKISLLRPKKIIRHEEDHPVLRAIEPRPKNSTKAYYAYQRYIEELRP